MKFEMQLKPKNYDVEFQERLNVVYGFLLSCGVENNRTIFYNEWLIKMSKNTLLTQFTIKSINPKSKVKLMIGQDWENRMMYSGCTELAEIFFIDLCPNDRHRKFKG